jgi:hypothetical protein
MASPALDHSRGIAAITVNRPGGSLENRGTVDFLIVNP